MKINIPSSNPVFVIYTRRRHTYALLFGLAAGIVSTLLLLFAQHLAQHRLFAGAPVLQSYDSLPDSTKRGKEKEGEPEK